MTIEDIKKEAAKLKGEIEESLSRFTKNTGETPIITITTTEEKAHCGLMVYQSANISINIT